MEQNGLFPKASSFVATAPAWLGGPDAGTVGQSVKGLRNAFASLTKAASIFRDQSLIDKCLTV